MPRGIQCVYGLCHSHRGNIAMPESAGISMPAADPRAEVWETLRGALSRTQLEGATRCAVRLYAELRDRSTWRTTRS
jgi:hypothetical protein